MEKEASQYDEGDGGGASIKELFSPCSFFVEGSQAL